MIDPNPSATLERHRAAYEDLRARGLGLDMTRGRPSPEQLDLASAMTALPGNGDHFAADGSDARNYGGVQGLPEIRALFSGVLGAPPERIVVGNNSSLAMMHDCLVYALLHGLPGGTPWARRLYDGERLTFLAPVPGYDRHFELCDGLGIRLEPVPLTGEGPDMDAVERLVREPSVVGMWAVPQFSNPSGETYSEAVVERLAAMETAAPDFRLFWDNAYARHDLVERAPRVANMLEACERAGHADRALVFGSTSKMTLAGAGLAFLAASAANVAWFLAHAGRRTIGPDKLNQLRHVRFLRDETGLDRLMDGHRRLIAPKFAALADAFAAHLEGVARWTRPAGGYFMLLEVPEGTARRVVALAAGAGLKLTPAGATHPGGRDPRDATIRLAPTCPSLPEVRAAADVIVACVRLAASEAAQPISAATAA